MAEEQNDGGPAFPQSDLSGYGFGPYPGNNSGMSVRDWFAGLAMQGMMARDSYDAGQSTPALRASLAYIEADAMIAARTAK